MRFSSHKIVPCLIIPCLFAKFALVPESFGQFYLWSRVFRHQNRYDIEAMMHISDPKYTSVNLGRSGDLTLFASIDIRDNRREFIRPPRLDLDKTKGFAIKRDYIDFASDLNAFAVAPDGYLEIGNDESIAVFDQEVSGEPFPAFAEVNGWLFSGFNYR